MKIGKLRSEIECRRLKCKNWDRENSEKFTEAKEKSDNWRTMGRQIEKRKYARKTLIYCFCMNNFRANQSTGLRKIRCQILCQE